MKKHWRNVLTIILAAVPVVLGQLEVVPKEVTSAVSALVVFIARLLKAPGDVPPELPPSA